jgi:hypothetical protein
MNHARGGGGLIESPPPLLVFSKISKLLLEKLRHRHVDTTKININKNIIKVRY